MVVGERQNVWQWQADPLTVYCDRDGTAQMDGSMNDKLWALYERGGGSRSMTS